jgi:hypothetical protein
MFTLIIMIAALTCKDQQTDSDHFTVVQVEIRRISSYTTYDLLRTL